MVIEIVDLPIKISDFPEFFVCLPEGIHIWVWLKKFQVQIFLAKKEQSRVNRVTQFCMN